MKKILYIIAALVTLVGCNNRDESHIIIPDTPNQDKGGAVIEFDVTGIENAKFTDTHIYGFDASQKLIYHKHYPTQENLAMETFSLEVGAHTFVAVLNMGKDFDPTASTNRQSNEATAKTDNKALPELTLQTLLTYLKMVEKDYPDMLTGMIQQQINTGEITHITLVLKKGADGVTVSKLKLTITLPDAEFEKYQETRVKATEPYNLRGVVEFYPTGKEACVSRQKALLTATATKGVYTMELEIIKGAYDLLIWADYTESGSTADLYYNTTSLKATHIIATDYQYTTGNDRREVFYSTSTATVTTDEQALNVAMERPLAKYTLIADDMERYRALRKANPEKYPELSDLNITINYEGYLLCGFNASNGKPNHSETGYKFQNSLPTIGAGDKTVEVASDYLLVNGTESTVSVSVTVTDRQGRKISQVNGVVVKYKRGMITTITGTFLTAGVINPGINIDTDWENTYEVKF